mmetsp:Transcript_50821/g.99382  ORF Transcript_50821/g.99382 Transcript_50821/m.99382 type:complete len:332 (-) Transcript_50821:12-1007(-)
MAPREALRRNPLPGFVRSYRDHEIPRNLEHRRSHELERSLDKHRSPYHLSRPRSSYDRHDQRDHRETIRNNYNSRPSQTGWKDDRENQRLNSGRDGSHELYLKKVNAVTVLQEQNLLNDMIRQQQVHLEQREIEKEKMEMEIKRNLYHGRGLSFQEERKKVEIDNKKKQIEVIKLELLKVKHRQEIELFKKKIVKLEDEYRKVVNLQKKEAFTIDNSPEFGENLLQQHRILNKGKELQNRREKKQACLKKKIEKYVLKNTLKFPNFLDRLKYERKIQMKTQKEVEENLQDQFLTLSDQRDELELKVLKLEDMMKRKEIENAENEYRRRNYR